MVHGLDTLKAINREACARAISKDIERMYSEHHKSCYGGAEFEFTWCELDCPGIWAYGGPIQDEPPVFMWAKWSIPAAERKPGWYCYIGPRPEFKNESNAVRRVAN